MPNRVGTEHVAPLRGTQERKEIKAENPAREALKRETARAKYRNAVKGKLQTAAAS
nr:hypothetical protein [uncultured Noviherbaspirillum sp.]